jgi:hypothetical protein
VASDHPEASLMGTAALVISDLKSGIHTGQLALYDLTGATYYLNFEVRATPDAPWTACGDSFVA